MTALALATTSAMLLATVPFYGGVAAELPAEGAPSVPWIDTHVHPLGGRGTREDCFSSECLARAQEVHDRNGVIRALLMLPPSPDQRFSAGGRTDRGAGGQRRGGPGGQSFAERRREFETRLVEIARSHPERFSFVGGGLQPLIQEALKAGEVSAELRRRFEARAREVVRAGAVGFGEITALHFSFRDFHPFVEVPPDHRLFLVLADLAAELDVPIDLHTEAVPTSMATPPRFLRQSPNNPPSVQENIGAFERLLSHNGKARIVWAHIGWDNTGHMTVDLLRRLLAAHPNLYLQIRIPSMSALFPQNNPLSEEGKLRPEWRDLIAAFPDRFVLGSDTFLARQDFETGVRNTASLLMKLPAELARKLGAENAKRIYRLP